MGWNANLTWLESLMVTHSGTIHYPCSKFLNFSHRTGTGGLNAIKRLAFRLVKVHPNKKEFMATRAYQVITIICKRTFKKSKVQTPEDGNICGNHDM